MYVSHRYLYFLGIQIIAWDSLLIGTQKSELLTFYIKIKVSDNNLR